MGTGLPVACVRDRAAVPDSQTLCTDAMQRAIDPCAGSGGDTVYFPPGTYLSGTLLLRNHVALHLEAGATLLGSPNQAHCPATASRTESRTNQYNV